MIEKVNVPQFIHNGKGAIINLHRATEISLMRITSRYSKTLPIEGSSETVSPYEWAKTPSTDRYINIEFDAEFREPAYQFYDGDVKPVGDLGSEGSATELFEMLFPGLYTVIP